MLWVWTVLWIYPANHARPDRTDQIGPVGTDQLGTDQYGPEGDDSWEGIE
jgi:hypothetical protein